VARYLNKYERLRMYIKCWGSRGSIPVSGIDYIKYGGDTTCLEIRTKSDDVIIVDAGTGIRRLGNKLMEEKRYKYNFIFTHAHWDHLWGLFHLHQERTDKQMDQIVETCRRIITEKGKSLECFAVAYGSTFTL
jgi:phosphoribosyl 1,2-cyclic phosphodiesterase